MPTAAVSLSSTAMTQIDHTAAHCKTLVRILRGALSPRPAAFNGVLNPVHEIDDCLHDLERGADPVRCWFLIHIAAVGALRDLARLDRGDVLDHSTYRDTRPLRTRSDHPCSALLKAMTQCNGLVDMREPLQAFELIARDEMSACAPFGLKLSRLGYVPAPMWRTVH